MAEKELVPSTETGVFDAEAMVRGMLRVIQHLGRERPVSPSSVVVEELPEAAGALALPLHPSLQLQRRCCAGRGRPEPPIRA